MKFLLKIKIFNSIQSRDYITEFSSFDKEDKTFSKIIVDARSLRNFLVRNSFNISIEAPTNHVAWIFCDYDLNSLKTYKKTKLKCDQTKKNLKKVSSERNANVFFPFFDSEDLVSFRSSDDELSTVYLSNRYKADSFSTVNYLFQKKSVTYLKIFQMEEVRFFQTFDSTLFNKIIDGVLDDRILEIIKIP